MLFRTHFVFGLFLILLFVGFVDNKVLFVIAGILGCIFPDLDSESSRYGQRIVFRPFQLFTRHRGFFHSLLFGFIISLFFSFLLPILGLGFFIGFSSHILLDSFTKEGIVVFWPFKKKSHGRITTGSFSEEIIFYFLVFFDVILFIRLILFPAIF